MTLDKNKGITSIEYNYLNLPTKVEFGSSSNRIEWKYAVTGAKLRKTVYTNGTVTSTIDYVSGFVYTSNNLNYTLDYFFTETGRIKRTGTGDLQYEYDIKDHLGNTRISFADLLPTPNQQPDILMESHYYAFGMRIEGLGSKSDNKYLYNGKELTEDFGLNWYEYGWRMYDGQLGRWHAVDPLDQFHSPYCYVGNNPTNLIDRDGMSGENPNQDILTPEEKEQSRFIYAFSGEIVEDIRPSIDEIIKFRNETGIGAMPKLTIPNYNREYYAKMQSFGVQLSGDVVGLGASVGFEFVSISDNKGSSVTAIYYYYPDQKYPGIGLPNNIGIGATSGMGIYVNGAWEGMNLSVGAGTSPVTVTSHPTYYELYKAVGIGPNAMNLIDSYKGTFFNVGASVEAFGVGYFSGHPITPIK